MGWGDPHMNEMTSLKRAYIAIMRGRVGGAILQSTGSALLRYLPGQITCQQFENFLNDYIDDRLSVAQQRLFERHMKVCPMCRVSLESYLKCIEMGQAVFDEDKKADVFTEAPRDLIDAIIEVSRISQDDNDNA